MLVHIDSTAFHVFDVRIENEAEAQQFKANGAFLNFAKEPIRAHLEVYVPKQNADWLAFSSDDILEINGTLTNLNEGMITVSTRNSTDRHCNCNTFNEFYHATTDKRIQMYVSAKTPKAMPSART